MGLLRRDKFLGENNFVVKSSGTMTEQKSGSLEKIYFISSDTIYGSNLSTLNKKVSDKEYLIRSIDCQIEFERKKHETGSTDLVQSLKMFFLPLSKPDYRNIIVIEINPYCRSKK